MLPRRPLRQGPPGLMRKGEETEEAAASLHLHASPSLGLYRPRVDVSLGGLEGQGSWNWLGLYPEMTHGETTSVLSREGERIHGSSA